MIELKLLQVPNTQKIALTEIQASTGSLVFTKFNFFYYLSSNSHIKNFFFSCNKKDCRFVHTFLQHEFYILNALTPAETPNIHPYLICSDHLLAVRSTNYFQRHVPKGWLPMLCEQWQCWSKESFWLQIPWLHEHERQWGCTVHQARDLIRTEQEE